MASMALMPVCSGSFTGWRCTTDGACSSRTRDSVDAISPLPSSGRPSGSTTRPRKPSPTGIDRISPVRRTSWPSSMCSASPMMTQPISRTSRLSARPRTPPWNSSSSLVMHECRPSTRAMPSPVSVTMPTSSRLAPASYDATMLSSASRISSGRIVNSVIREFPSFRGSGLDARASGHLAVGRAQVPQHTSVDELVTDADGEAAQQLGIDDDLQTDVVPELPPQRLGEPLLLALVERHGARDVGDETFPAARGELGVVLQDALDRAATGREHRPLDERGGDVRHLLVDQAMEQLGLALGRQAAVGQGPAQIRLPVDDPA